MEQDIKQNRNQSLPSVEEISLELDKLRVKRDYKRAFFSTLYALLVVAAIAVLISMLFLPVMKVTGSSMEPTLNEGEIIVSRKTSNFKTGDICSFYYNNRLLIKRTIAMAGDWVDIDKDGNVYVNGDPIEEPYVEEFSLGINDLEYPYQVPDGCVFVLGDHRATSIDSRSDQLGPIKVDEIVGKAMVRVWPLNTIRIY